MSKVDTNSTLFKVSKSPNGRWKTTVRGEHGGATHHYWNTEAEAWSFIVGFADSARARAKANYNLKTDREIEAILQTPRSWRDVLKAKFNHQDSHAAWQDWATRVEPNPGHVDDDELRHFIKEVNDIIVEEN